MSMYVILYCVVKMFDKKNRKPSNTICVYLPLQRSVDERSTQLKSNLLICFSLQRHFLLFDMPLFCLLLTNFARVFCARMETTFSLPYMHCSLAAWLSE